MSANGISTLATKALKQVAKLNLAQRKRQGYLVGNQTGSILLGSGTHLDVTTTTEFGFGTGEFTIEGWFYHTVGGANHRFFDFRTTEPQLAPMIGISTGNTIYLFVNGLNRIISTVTMPTNAWTHIALSKVGNSTRLFINGTQSGITYADTNDYGATRPVSIGADFNGSNNFSGYASTMRIVKGVGLYATDFTSSVALLNIIGTSLLLNTVYGSNFLVDRSSNAFTVTTTGSITSSSFSPTTTNTADTTATFYRYWNTYDINDLPTKYTGNALTDNANVGGLAAHRPWKTHT